jgi:hypothetical protein
LTRSTGRKHLNRTRADGLKNRHSEPKIQRATAILQVALLIKHRLPMLFIDVDGRLENADEFPAEYRTLELAARWRQQQVEAAEAPFVPLIAINADLHEKERNAAGKGSDSNRNRAGKETGDKRGHNSRYADRDTAVGVIMRFWNAFMTQLPSPRRPAACRP